MYRGCRSSYRGLSLRILILSWRCPRNPRAGGAETLTYEIARRLVQAGHYVEWFSASFPSAPATEELDGIRFVRAGRQWTVHLCAFWHYRSSVRNRFDVVVDEVNTVPFFSPLWAGVPVVMLIFQLAREVWWYESPFPLNAIGYCLEPAYLRVYRHTPVLTISKSTQQDLIQLGFTGPVTVFPVGIDRPRPSPRGSKTIPAFLYVGRLSPSKRIDHVLEAFAEFRLAVGVGLMWIIGSGSVRYKESLDHLARRLGISDSVIFWGSTPDPEKIRLMSEASALVMTSAREGWGLVVTEANACGTPAIVYDVPGLRDSVRHMETGLVVPSDPKSLAHAMVHLNSDRHLAADLQARARDWSEAFSYDNSARVFFDNLSSIVGVSRQSL